MHYNRKQKDGLRKPVKDEALHYMALASDEVRTVLKENVTWPIGCCGSPSGFDTHSIHGAGIFTSNIL